MRARELLLSSRFSDEEAGRILARAGFRKPSRVARSLRVVRGLSGDRPELPEFAENLFREALRAADPDAAILHLATLMESASSPGAFLDLLSQRPRALRTLSGVLGASAYLAQLLLRRPEYVDWLLEGDRFASIPGRGDFVALARTAGPPESPETALESLRRLRRRETLRIAAQDVLGYCTPDQTARQVSHLADAVLQRTFDLLAPAGLESESDFSVLALGKLGGQELNFSSDVDLLYVRADGTDFGRTARFARDLTRALSAITAEGRLYRVDLRLRPMGRSGEIVYSLDAYRSYYQTWGDTPDRLALIKCRHVAGSAVLGAQLVGIVQDEFVYKRYLDFAAIEEVRWLKRRAQRQAEKAGSETWDVKLGRGGIREIEFFAQAFQLLYGGSSPDLRTPNTLDALDRLSDGGLISFDDHRRLRDSYLFLRDVEHKLQLVQDLQTHRLPRDPGELLRLARRLGFSAGTGGPAAEPETDAFLAELERRKDQVRRIFESLFGQDPTQRGLERLVLNPDMSRGEALGILRANGIREPEVLDGIAVLEKAPSFPHSPSRMRNLLANLVPHLIGYIGLASRASHLFTRLDRFSESLSARADLYSELIENRVFRKTLLTVLATSEFLSESLIHNPELLDSVSRIPPLEDDAPGMRHSLEQLAKGAEDRGNALRVFKRREEFKVALHDLLEPGTAGTRLRLSHLADTCLRHVIGEILGEFPALRDETFCLLALGKLGEQQMTYHSDLDLLLVYGLRPDKDLSLLFIRLVRRLIQEMEEYTGQGRAYRMDFRLRPEGRHGALAIPFPALERYFAARADPWERMAYASLRPVYSQGEPMDAGPLIWHGRPFTPDQVRDLDHVRRRKEEVVGKEKDGVNYDFKVGRGGLMDIQFVVKYLQLQHGIEGRGTRFGISGLVEAGHLDPDEGRVLSRGAGFLFHLEALQRLLAESPATRLPRDPARCAVTARLMGLDSGDSLLERYRFETTAIRQIYRKFFSS